MSAPDSGGALGLGIHRPVGMFMVVLAMVVFGIVSLGKLPVDLLPPIDFPSLTVRTIYSGAAPQDVEERVTKRLEEVLSTVGGLVQMRSSSKAERSEILLEFEWGSNIPFLVQDVRERLDRVFLPPGVDRPLILRYDPKLDPILRVALSGGDDLVRLRGVAEREIERELEGHPGVAAVKVRGGLEDEIQVRLDPDKLAAYQVSSQTVLQRLTEENLNVPGGTLEEGSVQYVVRTLNEFRTLEEIEDLPLVMRGDRFLNLKDLASVARTHKDRDVILRVGGQEAVEVDIYREADANIVATADSVKDHLFGSAEQQAFWRTGKAPSRGLGKKEDPALVRQRMGNFIARKLPGDMKLTLLSDQSAFVSASIREVRSAGLIGGILAILICFFFLRRLSSTFVVALSIPISVAATFGPMYLAGVSLNIMSLGGLALGIGMLVDNTIVVLESITRCREEGDSPLDAALRGVREVGSAVTASTLTTIAVFAPIVFVEGVAGQTFGDQALTVVASLAISLAVALFFIPGVAARIDRGRREKAAAGVLRQEAPPAPGFFHGLRLLRHWWSWGLAGLCLAGAMLLFLLANLYLHGLENLQQLSEPGAVQALLRTPPLEIGPENPDLLQRVAWSGFAGLLLFLAGGWWLLEDLLLLGGRTLLLLGRGGTRVVRWASVGVLGLTGILLWPFTTLAHILLEAIQGFYPVILRRALHMPALVLLLAGAVSWLAWTAGQDLGTELLPKVMQGELTAELVFPAGSPLKETDHLALQLEQRLRRLEGVAESAVVSGSDRESVSTEEEGPHVARILLRIQRGEDSRQVERRVEEDVRRILSHEPALARFEIRRPTLLALHPPLEIEILDQNMDEVKAMARKVQERVTGMEGIVDLRSSIRRGNPEVRVSIDREKLAEYGLQLAQVAERMRLAVEGEVSSTFPGPDDRIDIRVRADLDKMKHVEQLQALPVNPESERPIPLRAVASISIADGPSEIRHINSRRAGVLTASLEGFDLGGITHELEATLAALPRPPSMQIQVGGQKAEMDASLDSLYFALALAVFLVYAVMAAQFESVFQPLLIMFSVPLAGVGALFGMHLTQTPVSVVALLGAVILAGIVVNNAIVLVDRINRNRNRGLPLDEAIVEAGSVRLRPILMTTVTTVLGMLPLTGWLSHLPLIGSIGTAEGTELRAPMALVVIAGLSFSTLLTLVVIPVGYRILALASPRGGASHA